MPIPLGNISASSLYIDPPRWDDLRVPLTSTVAGGANDPTLAAFRGTVRSWSFSNLVIQELFFIAQLPHYYKTGTDIFPHVHWSPSDAGAGNVVWGLEYSVNPSAEAGGTFPAPNTIQVIQAAAGVQYQHQRASMPAILGVGMRISAVLIGRLFRNTVGNTYASAAFGHEIDFHYQIDNIGSNNQTTKTDSGGI
jgi:hypothetical protein